MGKKLIIKGADFSANAVTGVRVVKTCGELLTVDGFYSIENGVISFSESTSGWHTAILPLHDNMYVENATALCYEDRVNPNMQNHVPSVIFLSSGSISGYISGSEIFVPRTGGSTVHFATYSGTLAPPAGATHVIINSLYTQGGSADSEISWDIEE